MVTAARKRHLLLGRKVMTNLDSILKDRDITLQTKILVGIHTRNILPFDYLVSPPHISFLVNLSMKKLA